MGESRLHIAWLFLLTLTVACALAVDGFGILPRAVEGARNGDYSTFYAAGRIERGQLYDFAAITRAQEPLIGRVESPRPYLNPPTYLFVLEPLSRLPPNVGLALWAVSTTLLFAAACLLVARPWAVGLALVSPVVWSTAAGGQVALLVGSCIVAAVAVLPRRPVLAGVLFAIAALIKPPAVVLAPLALVAMRQWRALAACLVAGLLGGLAGVLRFGPDLWLQWLHAIQEFSRFLATSSVIEKGSSPATIVRFLGLSGPVALGFQIACGVLGVAVTWRTFRRSQEPLVRLAGLTTGCLLVTPYAMTQELMPMLPFAATALLDRKAGPLLWFASFMILASLATPFAVLIMAGCLLAEAPQSDRTTAEAGARALNP
ncbi:MAG: glycosyltransferase family 87 protein [Parcubacteria group bacterium]